MKKTIKLLTLLGVMAISANLSAATTMTINNNTGYGVNVYTCGKTYGPIYTVKTIQCPYSFRVNVISIPNYKFRFIDGSESDQCGINYTTRDSLTLKIFNDRAELYKGTNKVKTVEYTIHATDTSGGTTYYR